MAHQIHRRRDPAPRSSRRARGTLWALTLAAFAYVVAENLPIGLLDPMARDLRVAPSALGLLVTGHAVLVAATAVPLTAWTARWPRRRVLLAALGVFACATAVAALSTSYGVVLAARVVTGATHAVFWSLVAPVATAGFEPHERARPTAFLFAGISLAPVLGVPAASWLGRATAWPVPFWVLAGLALVALLLFRLCATGDGAGAERGRRGDAPSGRAYRWLLGLTGLAVTAAFTAYTYVEPLLAALAGVGPDAISAYLLLFGLAGVVGVRVGGYLVARRARAAVLLGPLGTGLPLALLAVGGGPVVVLVAVAVWGAAMASLPAVLQTRVLAVAPFDVALASAGYVAAFNAAIAAGALLGALLLDAADPRALALAAAGLALLAVPVAVLASRR